MKCLFVIQNKYLCARKGAGVIDRTALEMRRTGNCTAGLNPALSANKKRTTKVARFLCIGEKKKLAFSFLQYIKTLSGMSRIDVLLQATPAAAQG
jgi:hypothetical protein